MCMEITSFLTYSEKLSHYRSNEDIQMFHRGNVLKGKTSNKIYFKKIKGKIEVKIKELR